MKFSSVYQTSSEAAPNQEEVEDIGIRSADRVQQRQQLQEEQYNQKQEEKGHEKEEEEEAEHFDLDTDLDNSLNSNNNDYDNNEAYIFDPIFVQQFFKLLRLGLLFETVRALGLEEELVSNSLLSCGNCNCNRYSDSSSATSSHIAADAAAGLGLGLGHGVAVLREGPARQVTIVENPAGRVEESRGEFVGFENQEYDAGVEGDEEGPNDDDEDDIWDTEYDEELWRARERRNGICLSDEEALQLRRFLGIE